MPPYRHLDVERAVIEACRAAGVPRDATRAAIDKWLTDVPALPCRYGGSHGALRPTRTPQGIEMLPCRCQGCIEAAVYLLCGMARDLLYKPPPSA